MKKTNHENDELNLEKINPDELAKVGEVILDPETGVQIQVTREAISQMLQVEAQVANAMSSLAMSLKIIRDNKFYLFRGCDSFKEYTERFLMYSPRHTQRLLSIADRFSDSEHYDDIASLPHRFLDEVRKDAAREAQLKDGEYTDAEGNVLTLAELKEMSSSELSNEVRTLRAKLKKTGGDLRKVKDQAEEHRKLAEEFESLAGEDRLSAIKEKNDIKSVIATAHGSFHIAIKDLNNIETEDPEILQELSGAVTGAITALSAIQDKYMHILLAAGK